MNIPLHANFPKREHLRQLFCRRHPLAVWLFHLFFNILQLFGLQALDFDFQGCNFTPKCLFYGAWGEVIGKRLVLKNWDGFILGLSKLNQRYVLPLQNPFQIRWGEVVRDVKLWELISEYSKMIL